MARRAKLAWLLLAWHWAFLWIQDGGSHHLGYMELSHCWPWWPTLSCNTSFWDGWGWGVHFWSYFVDTWSMSRSNRRSNVKFGSKIISIFVSSQSATSQRNRLPTSVMLFPNLSQWSCLLKIGSASSVRVTTRELSDIQDRGRAEDRGYKQGKTRWTIQNSFKNWNNFCSQVMLL